MTPVAIATEDPLSEAIVLRLIAEAPGETCIVHSLGKRGSGYLSSKMDSWRQMAAHQVMVVLTDLDRANCVKEFRDRWLTNKPLPEHMVFRVAVREVESWVLADHVAMRQLIGVKGVLPITPDELPDPKQVLLRLARAAPKTARDELVKVIDGNLSQGLGYNTRLTQLVSSIWSPQRAAKLSPSLARARMRLNEAVSSFAIR